MSQQYESPPPPPPPRSPLSLAAASGASSPERRRPPQAQPPSLATNLARSVWEPRQPSQTPISATTWAPGSPLPSTPATPAYISPRSQSLLVPPGSPTVPPQSSSMEPYNPRQWSSRQPVSGSQMIFSQSGGGAGPSNTRETTGMEAAMPSPPPPYSAGSGEALTSAPAEASSLLDTVAFTASPVPGAESSTRNSPRVPMSPAFPPPPGQSGIRDRSSSGQRGFFSLSNLRGKQAIVQEPRPITTVATPDFADGRPPAARRAASTGQIQSPTAGTPSSSIRASPDHGWQPGMPLPGPPPWPPPPGARTQSLNRYPESTSRSNSQSSEHSIETSSRVQRRTMVGSNLGPIPPTPADWVDPDAVKEHRNQQQLLSHSTPEPSKDTYPPLRIDTGTGNDVGLAQRPAKQDSSLQGLRERRSQSHAKRDSHSDHVFSPSDGSISQRREHTRNVSAQTSPLTQAQASHASPSNVLTPPYTPAVAKSHAEKRLGLKVLDSASSDRPISHLLHQPVADAAMQAPLTPQRRPSASPLSASLRFDAFQLQSIERHKKFIEQEAAASTDEERLELFANFMVHESRVRRDRYTAAYNVMAGDIVDLTRDMWRSYGGRGKRPTTSQSASPQEQRAPSRTSDGQPNSAQGNAPSSASSFGDLTPITDGGSVPDASDRQWGESFKPSLSPIPSMNVSSVKDDNSSRGRTASRWWEEGYSGSGSIGRPDRIEKTHRETKYMGIKPGDLREGNEPSPQSSKHTGSTPSASANAFTYGSNEYPPEKVGWHQPVDYDTPQATPSHVRERKASAPEVPPLDVSRLITLPPPYPRHHPAISNNHPLLTDLRAEHRMLSNHNQVREVRSAYTERSTATNREEEIAAEERRSQLRVSIQEKIADGTISFAEAAQAEADFDLEEAERGKANARSNFEIFEASMSHPLNDLLTERLEKANACIARLRIELESRNEIPDPNQAQEEGDEQPERLEKLTLLKWVFECREQLHKEMFDLHAERSAKYSEVILVPYRIANMEAKVDEATTFFSKDSRQRQTSHARDALKRYEELQRIMDTNVSRGVEDQLSAFWDIAPGLLGVVQHVPGNVADLQIQIPEHEYEENPAYNDYPLQYLYSLLTHAQRSAYQFIESQINLLCLLHEVRTATMKARLRLLEIERAATMPDAEALVLEMVQMRREQDERLTADLKEKVGEVERQWRQALGGDLEECKERVKGYLEVNGGLDDGLEG